MVIKQKKLVLVLVHPMNNIKIYFFHQQYPIIMKKYLLIQKHQAKRKQDGDYFDVNFNYDLTSK